MAAKVRRLTKRQGGHYGALIAARTLNQEAHAAETGELTTRRPGFVMVTVFDVAQTDALGAKVAA